MNKWISIKDKLPDSPEYGCTNIIIASLSTVHKKYHISFAEFQRGNFYSMYDERLPIDDPYWSITHWMPLPEPPND